MPNVTVKRFSRNKNVVADTVKNELESSQEVAEMEDLPEQEYENDNDSIDFRELFNDLKTDNFVPSEKIEKQQKENEKLRKEAEKEQRQYEKQQRQYEKQQKEYEKKQEKEQKQQQKFKKDSLFDNEGSILYGKDRLVLIAKINQYKALFPENKKLQQLKIKQGATLELLQEYINEIEALIETDTIEVFLNDSILQCIKLLELPSSRTKYDITGLSEMLRKNKQFNQLSKQLYIKYKVFSQIPPEAQMCLLVATSTYVCIQSNQKKKENNINLNKAVNIEDFEDFSDMPPLEPVK